MVRNCVLSYHGAQLFILLPFAAIFISGPQLPGDLWTWNVVSGELHRATQSATAGLDMNNTDKPLAPKTTPQLSSLAEHAQIGAR
jgi:hypothetical protein